MVVLRQTERDSKWVSGYELRHAFVPVQWRSCWNSLACNEVKCCGETIVQYHDEVCKFIYLFIFPSYFSKIATLS
jgi:hypothetical protein